MQTKDIIINGVSFNKHEEDRKKMRQGASQLISDNMEVAKSLTKSVIESKDGQEIEDLAKKAYEALSLASKLSDVCGISFFLPFYEEYGQYETKDIFSSMLENSDNGVLNANFDGSVNDLCNLFGDMEAQSRDWNSSTC